MFQNLRIGTPLYVLHKNEPKIEVGEVVNVSAPQPQFATAYQQGMAFQQNKMVVDVNVRIADNTINLQQLPAELAIADFGTNGMVISESKDAILNEIELLRKKSTDIIESIDYHRNVIDQCNTMIETLNPSARQDAEQRKEFEQMKSDMADIKGMLSELMNKKKEK